MCISISPPPGIVVDDHDDDGDKDDHDDEDEDDGDHIGRALVSVRRLALSRQASFSLLLIESTMRLREAQTLQYKSNTNKSANTKTNTDTDINTPAINIVFLNP